MAKVHTIELINNNSVDLVWLREERVFRLVLAERGSIEHRHVATLQVEELAGMLRFAAECMRTRTRPPGGYGPEEAALTGFEEEEITGQKTSPLTGQEEPK